MYIKEREQFKKDKVEHEESGMVCTLYKSPISIITTWSTKDEATERYAKHAVFEEKRRIASMSVLQFIKWKRNA